MAIARRNARSALTRAPLVLAPAQARRAWTVGAALLAALLAGVGASHAYWRPHLADLQRSASALADLQQLERQLEQTRLKLRLAEAQGSELERQIDTLNERLHKALEEAAFVRKARDGRP
jgi:septal ring factor EnvC (AmiA/AmiB activator)